MTSSRSPSVQSFHCPTWSPPAFWNTIPFVRHDNELSAHHVRADQVARETIKNSVNAVCLAAWRDHNCSVKAMADRGYVGTKVAEYY
jgi:hypothetical protein